MITEENPLHHICGPLTNELYAMEPRIKIDRTLTYEIVCYAPSKEQIGVNIMPDNKELDKTPVNLLSIYDHELGHMLEMCNLQRLVEKDFGIKEFVPEKRTSKAMFFLVLREVRVRAIQARLMGTPHTQDRKVAGPMNVVNHDFKLGRFSNKKELEQYAYELYDRTYAVWNEDHIRHEWDRRLEFIRNWMETA